MSVTEKLAKAKATALADVAALMEETAQQIEARKRQEAVLSGTADLAETYPALKDSRPRHLADRLAREFGRETWDQPADFIKGGGEQ